jgi:hypothetical protein
MLWGTTWTYSHSDNTEILSMNISVSAAHLPVFLRFPRFKFARINVDWYKTTSYNRLHLLFSVLFCSQCYLLKQCLDTFSLFGTRRQMLLDLLMAAQKLSELWFLHFSVFLLVYFVAHQDEGELLRLTWVPVGEKLGYPGLNVIERLDDGASTLLLVMS